MDTSKPACWNSAVASAAVPPAFLFARGGKLELQLLELTDRHAQVSAARIPPRGSAAVLSRDGARAIATVDEADAGTMTLAFDEPLSAWQIKKLGGVESRSC